MYTILHVDRGLFFQKILKEFSLKQEISLITANTPREAFKILEKNEIDLILTGLEFKGEQGEDFIEKLSKSKYHKIPIIVLTSKDTIEIRKKMFFLGVIDYIAKDLSVDRLFHYIEKLKKEDIIKQKLKELKIAVLDDSKMELNILKRIFEFHGINNVDYYRMPEELLYSNREYDIYLIDVILPNISGEQVILEVRSKYQNSVIIAVSSIQHYKVISNILLSGADDYIMKPFDETIFMARLYANARITFLLKEIEKNKLELESKNVELNNLVITDGLTRLYNHKYMYERLEKEIENSKKYKRNLSIIMFDIDHFKRVNDLYGHQMGDQVLIRVAEALKNSVREKDIVGRYGGEEFIVILPDINLEDAYIIANRIKENIKKLKFKEKELKIHISGGVVDFMGESALELVKRSDELLYQAKKNGRNRIEK